jgi:hypothetical protein
VPAASAQLPFFYGHAFGQGVVRQTFAALCASAVGPAAERALAALAPARLQGVRGPGGPGLTPRRPPPYTQLVHSQKTTSPGASTSRQTWGDGQSSLLTHPQVRVSSQPAGTGWHV